MYNIYNHFILHFRYHVIMSVIKFVVVDGLSIFNMMYHNGMISTKIGITVHHSLWQHMKCGGKTKCCKMENLFSFLLLCNIINLTSKYQLIAHYFNTLYKTHVKIRRSNPLKFI